MRKSYFSRHESTTIDELHAAVKSNHHKQTFRYNELGYHLETSKRHFFYTLMGNKETMPIFFPVETTVGNALESMITEMKQIRMKDI